MNPDHLEALLAPARIAVFGSTSKPTGVGRRVLKHLTDSTYRGTVLVGDPRRGLDSSVDVAVVAVPAAHVQQTLDRLAGRTPTAIVMSAGFEEAGGRALQPPPGLTLIGPNSVGLYRADSGLVLTFAKAFDDLVGCPPGSGAFLVSQSGAFGARLARAANSAGFALDGFVGTGNETGTSAVDVSLALLRSDRFRPRVLMLYLEAIRDVAALFELFSQARAAGVGVVLLYGGRTATGASAAASHTSALSSDYEILREAAGWLGVRLAESDSELLVAARAMAEAGIVGGRRITVVTGSGGAGVVAADAVDDRGLTLPRLSHALTKRVADMLPSFASVHNPIDVTAQAVADNALVGAVCREIANSGETDAILAIGRPEFAAELRGCAVPVVVSLLDGIGARDAGDGVTVADNLNAAAMAVAAVTGVDPAERRRLTVVRPKGRQPARIVTVAESMRLLQDAGIPVAPWAVADSPQLARERADALGYPVVLKTDGDAASHKALAGGVLLNIGRDDVEAAAGQLLSVSGSILLAAQCQALLELFVGVRNDEHFGIVVTAGIGGSHAELLGRTVTVPAGVGADRLAERLREAVFDRGGARYATLADRLAAVATAMTEICATGYTLVEVNPLAVVDDTLVALDARVITHHG